MSKALPPSPAEAEEDDDAPPDDGVALAPIDAEAACAMAPGKKALPKGSPRPYTRVSGQCSEGLCDWVDKAPPGTDACFVANANIARAEGESRVVKPAAASGGPAERTMYLDRVDGHLHFDPREHALLAENGFVVMERQRYASYAVAFHDVFQQQLPVYVSADAILNAVFQSTQTLLESAERTELVPRLVKMLPRMRSALASARYAPETTADLDLYLTVAEALLRRGTRPTGEAASFVAFATDEAPELREVALFGRARIIDFTQLAPRGYYVNGMSVDVPLGGDVTTSIAMSDYFRAMMWLSRVELNLVSRSCRSSHPGAIPDPTETPRETRDALALADLVRRSGSLGDLAQFERTYATFAGRREDVSMPELLAFGIPPGDPDAPAKLKAKIGDGFQRSARMHYMPEGAKTLPAIATLFGPRVAPDTAPLTGLVHDALPGRYDLGAADVAYVLGHDRAKTYLAADEQKSRAVAAALAKSRAAFDAGLRGKSDVYASWLRSVAALAKPAQGTTPSFMQKDAFADARISSALAGYAQIRHTFMLLTGQGYDSYGCEIPDGYVEPALAMYDALFEWLAAARGAVPSEKDYFDRASAVLGMLRTIARTELAGLALSEPQRRWLGMIAEYTPVGGYAGDSGEPPKYTGWYFDLFPDREIGAERNVALVADYFTLTNAGKVRYLGIDGAALGVFVVDTNGRPRAMVGPVAVPYETASPIERRLDDERAAKKMHSRAPWLASYAAAAAPEPTLDAELFTCANDARIIARSTEPLGDVGIELLDHHGDPITQTITLPVGTTPVVFAFSLPPAMRKADHGIEGFHVKVVGKSYDVVAGVGVYRPYDPITEERDARRTRKQLFLGRIRPRPELESGVRPPE